MAAGYPETLLAKRLGITGGRGVGCFDAPETFTKLLEPQPLALTFRTTARSQVVPLGPVDNKVRAIDDTWSERRVVGRDENR